MFAIEVQRVFHAAHALRLPGGGAEPAHAHDFHVTVKIACDQLDALETVLDFHPVESALEEILAPWRGGDLNDHEPFRSAVNPSAERIAEHIGKQIQHSLAAMTANEPPARRVRLAEVRITEAPGCLAIWIPD